MTFTGDQHARFREALAAASLDALAPDEREALDAHVATCAECRAELDGLRASVGELGFVPAGVDDLVRSPATRDRLLARARAESSSSRGSDELGLRRRDSRWWLAAAAMIVATGSLAWALSLRAQRDRARVALREQTETSARVLATRDSALEERARVISALTGSSVRVIDLASAKAEAPWARMFWDRATGRWTFVAHRLPRPGAGRTYQLWLVTPTSKISAGTFAPDARGDAVVQATYALDERALAAVAVTDEPAGGVPQPTGPIIVAGAPAK